MTDLNYSRPNRPYYAVATLIERHGLLRVLRAVAAAVLRPNRPRRVIAPEGMSAHLRRDVCLGEGGRPPRRWPTSF